MFLFDDSVDKSNNNTWSVPWIGKKIKTITIYVAGEIKYFSG